MKKYLTFAMFVVLTVVLVSPFSVSAKTKAGTKSGSFFYFFDTAFEKAGLFFTFNPEKKAKKALENAEERLAEAEESASENKPEAVTEAMENYKKNIEVLEKVLIKVPEESKEAITKAIEASKEKQEETMKETAELEKEVLEIKPEVDETENELKEEENEEDVKIKDDKKDEQKKEIEKLKKEVKALKQKTSQVKIIEKVEKIIEKPVVIEKTQSSSSQTKQNENIVTLPNGSVVEMDEKGKVVKIIKEAPEQTRTPQTTNNIASLSVSIGDIKITSSSVHLEWKTNIPTDSKIFLNQPDGSIKVFSSASGNSTMHFVDISNLVSGTSYTYTIETITDKQVEKKTGSFSTKPDSPTRMVAELSNSNFLGLYCDAPSVQVKIFDQDNKEMIGQDIIIKDNLNGETKYGQSPLWEKLGLISIKNGTYTLSIKSGNLSQDLEVHIREPNFRLRTIDGRINVDPKYDDGPFISENGVYQDMSAGMALIKTNDGFVCKH